MKAIVFFHSNHPGIDRVAIPLSDGDVTYVRAVVVEADDLADALDQADPDAFENVMNAHPHPKCPEIA